MLWRFRADRSIARLSGFHQRSGCRVTSIHTHCRPKRRHWSATGSMASCPMPLRGVAIMSAEQWLAFTEMRDQAEMYNLTWNEAEGVLTFEAVVDGESQHALMLLLPLEHRQRALRQVTIDSVLANAAQKRVGGVAYGAVALAAGRRRVRAYYR